MCLIGIPVMLLASCTSAKQDTQSIQDPVENDNTNVVKVLNRVECKETASYCNQSDINIIWKSCLTDGYVTELPIKQVISSRGLKELTRNSYLVNTSTPKEITDENGIVYKSEDEVVATQKEIVFTGYCIGSEYIVGK